MRPIRTIDGPYSSLRNRMVYNCQGFAPMKQEVFKLFCDSYLILMHTGLGHGVNRRHPLCVLN